MTSPADKKDPENSRTKKSAPTMAAFQTVVKDEAVVCPQIRFMAGRPTKSLDGTSHRKENQQQQTTTPYHNCSQTKVNETSPPM